MESRRKISRVSKQEAGAAGYWGSRLAALAFLAAPLVCQAARANATKVILDRATFGGSYALLRAVADRVAVVVDRLIPGQATSYPADGIPCSIGAAEAPVTLVGAKGGVRIVLSAKVLPTNYSELVFELAHELAHVKMDARYDNYLVEAFAVAVSLRVLKAVGSNPARQADIAMYTDELPQEVQAAIEREDWGTAKRYWQSKIPSRGAGDFSLAFLGALILEAARQPVWQELLNAGESSEDCVVPDEEFQVCSPALSRMTGLAPALRALGYSF